MGAKAPIFIQEEDMTEIRYGRKKNGIKKQLREKLDEWVETIKDDEVRKLVKRNTIVTGGSIASMLLGETINDHDVYFRDKETVLAVAKYYVNEFNEKNNLGLGEGVEDGSCRPRVQEQRITNIRGVAEDRVCIYMKSSGVVGEGQEQYQYFEDERFTANDVNRFVDSVMTPSPTGAPYRVVFMSQNAITLANQLQIVIRFYGEPEEIHGNYDFAHAMNYYDYHFDELVLKQEALECLLSRTLVYRGSLYPIASIFRTKKFIERGWRITAGQLLKIMWQISEVDLKDHAVVSEQMCGVDQAYMWQLVKALGEVDMNNVDATYIATIIDRIFD